jgi:hypothetical protein
MNEYPLNEKINKWRNGQLAIVIEFVNKPFEDCNNVLTIKEYKTLCRRADRLLEKKNRKFFEERHGKKIIKPNECQDNLKTDIETNVDKLNSINQLNQRHIQLLNKKIESFKESIKETIDDLHCASVLTETSTVVDMKPSYSKVLQEGSLAFMNINKMKLSAISTGYNPKRIALKLNNMRKREWEDVIIKEGVLFKQAAESKGRDKLQQDLHTLRVRLEQLREAELNKNKDNSIEGKLSLEDTMNQQTRVQYLEDHSSLDVFDEKDKDSDSDEEEDYESGDETDE